MRFMVIVKADKDSEAGVLPSTNLFEAEDFGPAFTPELQEQEEGLRKRVAQKQ